MRAGNANLTVMLVGNPLGSQNNEHVAGKELRKNSSSSSPSSSNGEGRSNCGMVERLNSSLAD